MVLIYSERMNILPFLSFHTGTADNLSEAGAGSVILSDASSQHNLAFSTEHMMGTQQVPNLSQTENSVQGHIYTSQQMMGHYQSNAGVRSLLYSLKHSNYDCCIKKVSLLIGEGGRTWGWSQKESLCSHKQTNPPP